MGVSKFMTTMLKVFPYVVMQYIFEDYDTSGHSIYMKIRYL